MARPRFHSGAWWEKVGGNGRTLALWVMFRGATKITLDDKGRMVMPNRYREQIAELAQGTLVVTVDKYQELLMSTLLEGEQIERKLMSLPSLNATARRLQRLMVGHATDLP